MSVVDAGLGIVTTVVILFVDFAITILQKWAGAHHDCIQSWSCVQAENECNTIVRPPARLVDRLSGTWPQYDSACPAPP